MAINVQQNIGLSQFTTLKVGGEAQYFVNVTSVEELKEAIDFAEKNDLAPHVLGGGSNILVSDAGVLGLCIHIQLMGMSVHYEEGRVLLTVGAGETLDEVIAHTVEEGWWGLENLSHIPGTVGATPVQNVGAYGVEAKDVIDSVLVFNTETKELETLQNGSCAFGYRDSLFKKREGKKYIIVSVTYALHTEPAPHTTYKDLAARFKDSPVTLKQIRDAVIEIRAGKFPNWHEVGTAGSFFKNPIISKETYMTLSEKYPELPAFVLHDGTVKVPLGWILDKVLHLRGFRKGNVEAYKDQALVLVAYENATAAEITAFANEIVSDVLLHTNVPVEWEVTTLG